jgi:hypothetical protein
MSGEQPGGQDREEEREADDLRVVRMLGQVALAGQVVVDTEAGR